MVVTTLARWGYKRTSLVKLAHLYTGFTHSDMVFFHSYGKLRVDVSYTIIYPKMLHVWYIYPYVYLQNWMI